MIAEFSLRPKAQNKRALYLLIAFAIGAAAFAIWYIATPVYRGVIGLGAMAFVIAAVFMYTKFIAVSYSYDIFIANDTPLFTVRQLTGKRETTLCRIELRGITSVVRMTPEERKGHKTPTGYVKYNYCPTIGPDVTYMITYVTRYEKAEITIEANDEFADILMRYADEARGNYVDDEF
ncbi:MAG: hypothetical protein IKC87_00985 [Clostridia bacterium]|nr:hypothetical protein [Clostridia bacterium]